jgi:hypothetical protein
MMSTTPKRANGQVGALCRLISREKPEYLETGTGKSGCCYLTCLEYYLKNPGTELVPGWVIWEGPGIVEAEHHTVIRENGKLRDLTAPFDKEDKVLFLPDSDHPATFENGHFQSYENVIKKRREKFLKKPTHTENPLDFSLAVVGTPKMSEEIKQHFLSFPVDNYFSLKAIMIK